MKKILIIDDEKDIRFLLSSILVDEGYLTIEAGDITGAEKKIDGEFFDLALRILQYWINFITSLPVATGNTFLLCGK